MSSKRSGDVPAGADSPAQKKTQAVSVPVACAMRVIGRTARFVTSAASGVATCILAVGRGAAAHMRIRGLDSEIAQLKKEVKQLHAEIGQRVCELELTDEAGATRDSKLKALLLLVQEKEHEITLLEAGKLQLESSPVEAERPEARRKKAAKAVLKEKAVEAVPREEDLAARVRDIIQRSQEGISLSEMGEHLGTTWQRLTPIVKALIESNVMRKDGNKYYPA